MEGASESDTELMNTTLLIEAKYRLEVIPGRITLDQILRPLLKQLRRQRQTLSDMKDNPGSFCIRSTFQGDGDDVSHFAAGPKQQVVMCVASKMMSPVIRRALLKHGVLPILLSGTRFKVAGLSGAVQSQSSPQDQLKVVRHCVKYIL